MTAKPCVVVDVEVEVEVVEVLVDVDVVDVDVDVDVVVSEVVSDVVSDVVDVLVLVDVAVARSTLKTQGEVLLLTSYTKQTTVVVPRLKLDPLRGEHSIREMPTLSETTGSA
jgi:ABC-type Na+ efflux pump permease subunit